MSSRHQQSNAVKKDKKREKWREGQKYEEKKKTVSSLEAKQKKKTITTRIRRQTKVMRFAHP